jgi:hypothetical protein
MRVIHNISPLLLTILLFLIICSQAAYAGPITVSIQLNGVTVVPGATKTVQVCIGSVYNLRSFNSSATPPSGIPAYEWKNLDSLRTVNSNPINTTDAGRWVATIKYYNNISATWTTASDTITLVYATTTSLQITTTSGTPITAPTIFICGLRDSSFLATAGHTNYRWYKNNTSNLVSSSNLLNITNTMLTAAEGTVSFFVVATNSFGCEVTVQKNFRRDNSFSVNLGPDQNLCSGASTILSSPSSPTGILFLYKWNTGSNATTLPVNTTGTYWLTVTNNGTKCPQSDTVKVVFSSAPIVTVTKDTTICNNTSVQLNASVSGAGSYTYAWTPTTGLSNPSISNPIATPTTIGINTYSVSVTNSLGCGGSSLTSTDITQLAPFITPYTTLFAGNDTALCYQSTGQLNAQITFSSYPSTYTWQWSPATGLNISTINNPTVSISSAGLQKYIVTATDARGCKLKDSLNVNQLDQLTTTTNFSDSTSCVGTAVTLSASATGGSGSGYSYNFLPAQGSLSANNLTLTLKDSIYLINVSTTDSDGCTSPAVPVTLTGYRPYIQIASGPDTIGYGGNPLVLNANIHSKPSVTVVWYELPSNATIAFGTTYTSTTDQIIYAIATDNLYTACLNSDTVSIVHRPEDLHALFIPNVFSPHATEVENQALKVFGTEILETDFNFRVYDQWGQLVYQTSSFIEARNTGWSGSIKNNDGKQSNNVYTYTVEGKFFDGVDFNKTGTATMLQ